MQTEEILLENNLREQNAKVQKAQENIVNANKDNIDRLNNFYIYLTTLSSGAIVLSVSFLSSIGKIEYVNIRILGSNFTLLYLTWFLLFLSIFFGLVRTYKHIEYSHLFRLYDVLKNEKELREMEKKFMEVAPNRFGNPEDINFDQINASIKDFDKNLKKALSKKDSAYNWTRICEIIARDVFVIGILLLIGFAILSLKT